MIAQATANVLRLKRWLDRAYWSLRVRPLSKPEGSDSSASPAGLVLVQVDGLSQPQLQRALAEGRLPFLRRLIKNEKYAQYAHYSGLPSATPGVQGELFYGVKGCVPAFHFVDRETNKPFVMYDPKCAAEIERRLAAAGHPPLLEGGSSYSNIFCGGAAESHYCAAGIGWKTLFKSMNPISWPLLVIFHFDIFVRTFCLAVAEFFISVYEGIRGILKGERPGAELKFVLMRMIVCVFLRELTVLGARIDVARGLPVIHVNFFGYDEQAHRRGPASQFAHWSLRGIDSAISRIWRQTLIADRRDYDLWIYSDHGQEGTLPYPVQEGRRIEEAVFEIFGGTPEEPRVQVTGMGPLAHIYPAEPLSGEALEKVVRDLIEKVKAPLVLVPIQGDPDRRVRAYTRGEKHTLPEDAADIVGKDHPFFEEVTEDLLALCHHPGAGRLILSGWVKGQPPRTFPLENGSHAGFGPHETNGFALLPPDAPLARRPYLRPLDIRVAALRHLGRSTEAELEDTRTIARTRTLRVMTYNVHGCVGLDGKLSPARIARVIARHDPDVVALQELDVCRARSGCLDQVKIIADKLKMNYHFHPSFCVKDEKYGNAVLSRHPMRLVRVGALPQLGRRTGELRGALWVEIDVGLDGGKVQLFNTHLSLWQREGLLQARALQTSDWLKNAGCEGPVLVCGDFNALPRSPVFNTISQSFRDAQLDLEGHRARKTWAAFYPVGRIDHVFIGPKVKVLSVDVPRTVLERVASDHLPLVVEVEVPSCTPSGD